MKSLCVFCGSSVGSDPAFAEAARALGIWLAKNEIALVYGGANVGLMGMIADATLQSGGKAIGVLPDFLRGKEIAHTGLTKLITCSSMHERKMKMFELSEGFLALPGGFGTLEEIIEVLTWQQLGLHKFPVAFLNLNGFYSSLRSLFDDMEKANLLKSENKSMALFGENLEELLQRMQRYQAPTVSKWIK